MPTYEELMRDRNKKRGLSGITKPFAKTRNLPQGFKIMGILQCPHCEKSIETIIHVPNIPIQVYTKIPHDPDSTIKKAFN